MARLREFLKRLSGVLPTEAVAVDVDSLEVVNRATFETPGRLSAVVFPQSTEEVTRIVRLAAKCTVPLHFASRGCNWGYGSRRPARDSVLVNLARMRRVIEFNNEQGWARIEAGVSQGDLREVIRNHGDRWIMDVTGAGPDASVIGNIVERGFGHTPLSDRFANSCDWEIVLADGTVFRSGLGRFEGCRAKAVFRYGLGPSVEGLFSQSGSGVVVAATVWLFRRPERILFFKISVDREGQLGELVERVRPLRSGGTLRHALHIANSYKALSGLTRFPFDHEAGRSTPLSSSLHAKLCHRYGVTAWAGVGALYGSKGQVRAAFKDIRNSLRGSSIKVMQVPPWLLRLGGWFAPTIKSVAGIDLEPGLITLRGVMDLLEGNPTPVFLESCFWRKPATVPLGDPDESRCGLRWYAPIAPLDGQEAAQLATLGASIVSRHGFEPQISITFLTERALAVVFSLCWDRDLPGEDGRADACFKDLAQSTLAAGYLPYRAGPTFLDFMNLSDTPPLLVGLRAMLNSGAIFDDKYHGRSVSGGPPLDDNQISKDAQAELAPEMAMHQN